jgi:SAM-dependent methyltransferase
MKRLPEPELMDQPDQARAYADADFSEPNALFVDLFAAAFPDFTQGLVADLGCGPADIPVRLVDRYPRARVIAVDGAAEMLKLAAEAAARAGRRRQRFRSDCGARPPVSSATACCTICPMRGHCGARFVTAPRPVLRYW